MTVNCNAATRQVQVVAYSNTSLASGAHTIKIVKNSGTYMEVDAFAYVASSTPTYTITASAGANGSITPSGNVNVAQGANQTFSITANSGYQVSSVTVDGAGVGAVTSYAFNNVQANHTISASFSALPDFSISASPSSQTVTAGSNTTYTATVSALNGFSGTVNLSVSGLPSGASGNFNPISISTSGSSTLTITTATNTPAGTNTLTITGTSGSLQHSATVTLIVNAAGATNSNIAPSGTAYGWNAMSASSGNSPKIAMPGLNDNNLTTDVDIDSAGDSVGAWEAAGVTWSSAKTITSANFINGTITSGGDGFLTANCKLQFSTDGSTWTDSGWTISPAYPNSSAAGGQTYTFSGTAVSGKLGARVIGQVRTTDTSYHWIVKEVRIIGH
jgi:hypothetical protein